MGTSDNDALEVATISVSTPKDQQLSVMAGRLLSVAESYKITTPQIYELAADDLQSIKTKITTLNDQRLSITRPIDEAKEKVMSLFRSPIDTLKKAEKIIKDAMIAFDTEQERIRRELEDKKRREQEAEQQRLAAEAEEARRRDEEAQAALDAATTPEEVAAATTHAEQAAHAVQQVEERKAEVEHAPAPIVVSSTPRVSGISTSVTWKGECIDKMLLIKAVAEGKAPITLLDVNETVLNQMARALKETMSYPGCKAVEVKGISSRRK